MTFEDIEKEFWLRFVDLTTTPVRAMTLNNEPLVMGKAEDILAFLRHAIEQFIEATRVDKASGDCDGDERGRLDDEQKGWNAGLAEVAAKQNEFFQWPTKKR